MAPSVLPDRTVPITRRRAARAAWCVPLLATLSACAPAQQEARLGDCRLESGAIIRDCRVGYRTAGQLDPTRSNAILVLPWFRGTSSELTRQIGPDRLVDTSRYYAILVDPLANGVSSSPSTSASQPGTGFPRVTIRDFVDTEYLLLTRVLGLTHVRAVVGTSMGGMQVFTWITAYPGFMDKAVAITGSPRSQPDDQGRWRDTITALTARPPWKRAASSLFGGAPWAALREYRSDSVDSIRQAEAAMGQDVSIPFQGSMDRAAAAVTARLLVVGTRQDREVNPEPAFAFAKQVRSGEVFELEGSCGHQSPSCERATMWPVVRRFLDR